MLDARPDTSPELASAITAVGVDLLQKLHKTGARDNLFISPFSIATAVAMIGIGARGTTQEEMFHALHLTGKQDADVVQLFGRLLNAVQSDESDSLLKVADAIFVDHNIHLEEPFIKLAHAQFKADARPLDFSSSQSVTEINNWVSTQTNGKIAKLVEKLNPSEVAVLLNAVYFKGKWRNAFPPENTASRDFHITDNQSKSLLMMSRTGSYPYLNEDGLQAIALPYKSDRFTAYVVLPSDSEDLGTFIGRLSAADWERLLSRLSSKKGTIILPKFRVEYSEVLNTALQALGMRLAFSDSADFAKMHAPPPPLAISRIIHKTYVDVDEQGTEAAAVTGGMMSITAAPMVTPPFRMVVDRPFVFAIRENVTGTLLFIGSIFDPEQGTAR